MPRRGSNLNVNQISPICYSRVCSRPMPAQEQALCEFSKYVRYLEEGVSDNRAYAPDTPTAAQVCKPENAEPPVPHGV